MAAIASQFTAQRHGDDVRVAGSVEVPGPGWRAELHPAPADADLDHDPTELRLALTASGPEGGGPDASTVVVDQSFAVSSATIHVVVSLAPGVETERYAGDSLNLPIE